MQARITAKNETDTFALGVRIARALRAGDTVLIFGELGAGKTVLSQGIAQGLGVLDVVTSPSFTIVNEYPWRNAKLIHMDQYRITADGFYDLGLDEYWDGNNIVLVEWPREAPPCGNTLTVTIRYQDGGRDIILGAQDGENGRWEGLFDELAGD